MAAPGVAIKKPHPLTKNIFLQLSGQLSNRGRNSGFNTEKIAMFAAEASESISGIPCRNMKNDVGRKTCWLKNKFVVQVA